VEAAKGRSRVSEAMTKAERYAAEAFPIPESATEVQRWAVERIIREQIHPDTLRRKPRFWSADYFDCHAHVSRLCEAGKGWFVDYLEQRRDTLGALPDDGED
jgi:hypothetical protein